MDAPRLVHGLIAMLAAAALTAPEAQGQSGRQEVVRVAFAGNASFSDAELRRAILTQASSCPPILSVTTCALGIDWFREVQTLSPRVLEDDVRRLVQHYRSNGFRGTTVAASATPGAETAVTFTIDEGTLFRVGSIAFTGDSVPAGLDLAADIPVAPGDPASYLVLVARDTLAARLQDAGYAFAEVFYGFDRARGSDTASVSYRIELGPRSTFGPIEVRGNRLLDEEVVLNRLPFREGELFRESAVREAQRSLHELGIVSRAQVRRAEPGGGTRAAPDSVVPIVVEVVEGDRHRFRTGGGANSADCFNVEGSWNSRNFLGGGRTLQLQGRLSNLLADALQSTPLCSQAGTGDFGRPDWLAAIDFRQPSLGSRRNELAVGLFAERQSRKNIFVRDGYGMDLGFSRSMGPASFLNVRYRPQLSRLHAAEVTLCATFLACTPEDRDILASTNWLSPLAVSFNQDRSNDFFNPTDGFKALVDVEFASRLTGSDYAYTRAFADASLYRRLGASGAVFALRVRGGHIWTGGFLDATDDGGGAGRFATVVPSQKRFYGGGPNSVRGFSQNGLGPASLSIGVERLLQRPSPGAAPPCTPESVPGLDCDPAAVDDPDAFQLRPVGGRSTLEASAEVRFDLAEVLGGVAFVDVGQVWPDAFALSAVEMSPGVGLRYNTPFGPIRLDLAYSFREQRRLQVITSQIRRYLPGRDEAASRIDIAPPGSAPEPIEWVVDERLAVLDAAVAYGDGPGFSLGRFQLHFSVGQAF